MYERKSIQPRELKIDTEGEGTFEGIFATMNIVDKDGDLTEPGAFGEQKVLISQYNHGSWANGKDALPIGVGKIFERGNDAVVQGEFNLESDAARETYKTMKYISEKGYTQEFSYALPDIDYEFREVDGRQIRVLKRISVPEVSPVLLGAGENTRLLSIKGVDEIKTLAGKMKVEEDRKILEEYAERLKAGKEIPDSNSDNISETFADHAERVQDDVAGLVKRCQDIAELRRQKGKGLGKESVDRIKGIHAELKNVIASIQEITAHDDTIEQEYLKFIEGRTRWVKN